MFDKFQLRYLKELGLSSNHLKTLSFLKLIKSLSFQSIYLNYNEIKFSQFDFDELFSIKNLKKLEIQYNLLSDINIIKSAIIKAKEKGIELNIKGNNFNLNELLTKIELRLGGIKFNYNKYSSNYKKE